MEVKPHQIAQVAKQTENLSRASNEAKNILNNPNFDFKGSIFGCLLISNSTVLEMVQFFEYKNGVDYFKGPVFPIPVIKSI